MDNKKKKAKDYAGLFLKIAGIFFIIMILTMFFSAFLNVKNLYLFFEIARAIVLLSMFLFFVSVIHHQFENKRILWGIINTILLIYGLLLWREDIDEAMFLLAICFISCLVYGITLKIRKIYIYKMV